MLQGSGRRTNVVPASAPARPRAIVLSDLLLPSNPARQYLSRRTRILIYAAPATLAAALLVLPCIVLASAAGFSFPLPGTVPVALGLAIVIGFDGHSARRPAAQRHLGWLQRVTGLSVVFAMAGHRAA